MSELLWLHCDNCKNLMGIIIVDDDETGITKQTCVKCMEKVLST